MSVRQPVGVAGLIISFNTPLPNVAWKVFPALLCGNARRAQAFRGDAALGSTVRDACQAVGLPARRPQRRPGARVGGRRGARRARRRRPRQLHGLGSHRAVDRGVGGAAAREDLPRAGRQERARRLRRRRPRRTPSVGRRSRRSRTPGSAARLRAGSSSSTRCTTSSAAASSRPRRGSQTRARSSARRASSGSSTHSRGRARRGATVLCGGERLPREGWWLPPTVLEDVALDAEVSCTELFGPVDDPLSRPRPVGGALRRERLAVRPDGSRAHREPPSCDATSQSMWRQASSW